jgi:hypothetical protein
MYLTCNPYFVKQNEFTIFVLLPVSLVTFDLWTLNVRSFKQNCNIDYRVPNVKLTVINNVSMTDVGSSEMCVPVARINFLYEPEILRLNIFK